MQEAKACRRWVAGWSGRREEEWARTLLVAHVREVGKETEPQAS